MTPKGAAVVMEELTLRVFQIQDTIGKLLREEAQLQSRIKELKQIRDSGVVVSRIIQIG